MEQQPKLVKSVYSEPYYIEEKHKKNLSLQDLENRINSQSKRINKLQQKLNQIVNNQRYYINKRLPDILKREKAKADFVDVYKHATNILKAFTEKDKISFLSKSKDPELKETRYIGLFTNGEMYKLRLFLADKRERKFKEKVNLDK